MAWMQMKSGRSMNLFSKVLTRKCHRFASSSAATACRQLKTRPVVPTWRNCGSTMKFTTSGSDHHAFYQKQLEELEKERKSFFGEDSDPAATATEDDVDDLVATGNRTSETTASAGTATFEGQNTESDEYEIDLVELHAEREALFEFSSDEKHAWSNQSNEISGNPTQTRLSPELLREIEEARAAAALEEDNESTKTSAPPPSENSTTTHPPLQHHESLSHVSSDGKSIHMVDVGNKQATSRMARARTKVILPVEVLEAFDLQASELVGPKGPIFATAKLAGIMAAKKASDLIPLCHPLPLDQVQVDIRMVNDCEVWIDCTCRVTHKTGVEMEALTGASVAALTIYDMVKAVSHRVEITNTKLLSKTGGKRTIDGEGYQE